MEPLKLRGVNWQAGMLIRHEHLDAIDQQVRDRTVWALRHITAYGVVRPYGSTVHPIELDHRVERGELIVRVLRCLGITPAGDLINIQSDSRMDLPEIPGSKLGFDPTAPRVRIPVVIECADRAEDLLAGDPEVDGRVPWRVPRWRVHLELPDHVDRARTLKIAEILIEGGKPRVDPDFLPATPWMENLPEAVDATVKLFEAADQLRDAIEGALRSYAADAPSERGYSVKRGLYSEVLVRLAHLGQVRPEWRCRTAPDAVFAAVAGLLDGLRTMLDANDALKAQIKSQYVLRQPPVHPEAGDFLRGLDRVRNWRFDPEGMGDTLRDARALLRHAARALAETALPFLGVPQVDDGGPNTFSFEGQAYTIQDQLSVEFTREYLVIAGFGPGMVGTVAVKFARADLPPKPRYACMYAADMENTFDLKDPDIRLEKDGYAYAILPIGREIKRNLTIRFAPGDPLALLRDNQAGRGRHWFIGVR